MDLWKKITLLGAAEFLLPLAILTALALWCDGRRAVMRGWLAALVIGATIVLITKVAFMGWGIGSVRWNFTGISGHATLATSIYPITFATALMLLFPLAKRQRADREALVAMQSWHAHLGWILGLGLGVVVAISRVIIGAHSTSECVLGVLLGAGMSAAVWPAFARAPQHRPRRALAIGLPMTGLAGMAAVYLSFPQLRMPMVEHHLAVELSGRSTPYTRDMLLRRAAAPQLN